VPIEEEEEYYVSRCLHLLVLIITIVSETVLGQDGGYIVIVV
jgi:hypothetical protein